MDHQENQDILPIDTLIEQLDALNGQTTFTGISISKISKTIKNLEKDNTKYPIDKLITIAEKNTESWDYIIEHLFLNRDKPYSATDIVSFLCQGNIRIEFSKNSGVDLLKKLINLDWPSVPENLNSEQERKSFLSNFAGTIKLAQSSFKGSKNKEGLSLIQDLTNKIKNENSYHESFDINIKKKKHNFFTKLFRRLFRRHDKHLSKHRKL